MENFQTTNSTLAINYANECISNPAGHEGLLLFLHQEPFLATGLLTTSDTAAATALNIPVWTAEHLGGSIVCFPGDLSLCLTTWGNTQPLFGEECIRAVGELCESIGATVFYDNNDCLVDNFKVASWATATTRHGWVQTGVHFSVNTDLNLITLLCLKQMNKIPGQLSDYNITANDILHQLSNKHII